MSGTITTTLFQLSSWDARLNLQHVLGRSKLLVGSDKNCDLVIDGPGVSPHHCYLVVSDESVRVIDLASSNGTFVNGKRVKDTTLFLGDTLTIADIAFNLGNAISDLKLENSESSVVGKKVADAATTSVVIPEREGLVLIDQEYCDLNLISGDLRTASSFGVSLDDAEALESIDAPLDLVQEQTKDRVEIVTYSCGNVLDVSYVDLDKGGPILSPNLGKGKIWFPGIKVDTHLLKSEGTSWLINCPEGFTVSGQSELSSEPVFLTFGVHQVSLRLVDQTFKINPLPFLWRDRAFYKEAAKVAAGVFIPFLLLLLISIPEMVPEETKQITIVYKAQEKTDGETKAELAATEVTSQTENTGTKSTEQPQTKPQMAAAAAAAKSQAPSEAASAAPAKPKAYSFKSSVSLDSVVADAAPAKNTGTGSGRNPAAVGKGFGASTGALNGTANGKSLSVGTLGSDASGVASASSGAKGLVSKKGFDHSYLEPKTVVLGSMDPELLRKILQEYLPQFRHCYQQELITAAKDIKGVIDLDFQISPDGRVSRTNVKAKDARFTRKGMDCMASVLRIIEFPKPKGGGVVDVRQPLNFFAETEKI